MSKNFYSVHDGSKQQGNILTNPIPLIGLFIMFLVFLWQDLRLFPQLSHLPWENYINLPWDLFSRHNYFYGFIIALAGAFTVFARLCWLSFKFSDNFFVRFTVATYAVLGLLPLADLIANVTDQSGIQIRIAIDGIETGSVLSSQPALAFICSSADLAWPVGVSILGLLLLQGLIFPKIYLRRNPDGLSIGVESWSSTLAERTVRWQDLESVRIERLNNSKRILHLKVKNVKSIFSFDLAELQKSLDLAELMNDIGTYAPAAIDESFVFNTINSDSNDHAYTELWLKYFSSSSSRQRTGGLQAGERLHEGRYEIAGELGQGGQGTAYLASDHILRSTPDIDQSGEGATGKEDSGVTLVLKEYILPVHRGEAIFQQSLKKLQHEAEILSKIDHPNIVQMKDTFVEDHRGYLVLEYVEGDVLKQLVQMQGPQPERLVIDIALQACDALEHLHNMDPPIIHRDLTPDNLILQPDGRIKLVDFNVAQQLEPTATSTVVGKHAYIPPEQFRGKPTKQSDIFALGGTLFYLLTAQDPEPLSVSHPGAVNKEVSEGMDSIVARATCLDESQRFADANELRQALLIAQSTVQLRIEAERLLSVEKH